MADDLKALWESLKGESPNSSELLDPERLRRIDAVMSPIHELMRQFQRAHDHQPFDPEAPCPICGGTVTYWYRAPLIGGMKCDTAECIAVNV